MRDPAKFLTSLVHTLSIMVLYPEGHPSRERSMDEAYTLLDGLLDPAGSPPTFTFVDDSVVYGREPLSDLKSWEWGPRFVAAGIQRIEFERDISREEFEGLLEELLARLVVSQVDTSGRRQMRSIGARFGAAGVAGQNVEEVEAIPVATLDLTLGDEAETFRWLQNRLRAGGGVPLIEAEAIVRSLSVAMHGDSRMVMPLLQLKGFDQYTTTHSLNVAVLSMALAETLGCYPEQVRNIGIAGLLHDVGKIRIPIEVLTKPGRLTDDERLIMNRHPEDGARLILQSEDDLDLAATVAYEHHIRLDGGGYPSLHYKRDCALASRLVHVCDVFDALSTRRPYRDAWLADQALRYLENGQGQEFDTGLVTAFVRMFRENQAQVHVLAEDVPA